MREIALVGAFDRYNYGDLLFPLIVRDQIQKRDPNVQVRCYGLSSSDLSGVGAIRTDPIRELYGRDVIGVVVAGGQVLNATWANMHLNLVPQSWFATARMLYRAIGHDAADALARQLHGGRSRFPFVIPPSLVGGAPVVYNAVGGTSFARWSKRMIVELASSLNSAQYLSVRDPRSRLQLERLGVRDVHLAPDCAVLVAELQADDRVTVPSHFADNGTPYICFQVGKGYARGHITTIARQLRNFVETTEYGILLLPIGLATGHEDDEPLREIQALLSGTDRCVMESSPTIQSTLAAIAGSSCFVGSSLHGALTAFSFGVPSVGYSKVLKQEDTMSELVGPSWTSFSSFSDLCETISHALEGDRNSLHSSSARARAASLESFDELLEVVLK